MFSFSGNVRLKDEDAVLFNDGTGLHKIKDSEVRYSKNDMYLKRDEEGGTLFVPSFGHMDGICLTLKPKEKEENFLKRVYDYAQKLPDKSLPLYTYSSSTLSTSGLAIPNFNTQYGQLYTALKGRFFEQEDRPCIILDRREKTMSIIENCRGSLSKPILSIPLINGESVGLYGHYADGLMGIAAVYLAQSKIPEGKIFGIVKENGHRYLAEIAINSSVDIEVIEEVGPAVSKIDVPRQPFITISYDDDAAFISGAYMNSHRQMTIKGTELTSAQNVKEAVLYYALNMLEHIENVRANIGDDPNLEMFKPSQACLEFADNCDSHKKLADFFAKDTVPYSSTAIER